MASSFRNGPEIERSEVVTVVAKFCFSAWQVKTSVAASNRYQSYFDYEQS